MPTIADYRRDMRSTRLETAEALRSIPGLAAAWLARPRAGEGEESWSPREIAMHLVYGEWYMLDGTVQILSRASAPDADRLVQSSGEAALLWSRLKRDQQGGLDLPGPEEAATALLAVGEKLDPLLELFTDGHLALTVERQTGTVSMERRLGACLEHAVEHLNQLRSSS